MVRTYIYIGTGVIPVKNYPVHKPVSTCFQFVDVLVMNFLLLDKKIFTKQEVLHWHINIPGLSGLLQGVSFQAARLA